MVLDEKTVAVVVPAYNEEKLVCETLRQIPEFVDLVYVVDDCSTDQTAAVVSAYAAANPRVVLIRHQVNGGVGAAIMTGYKQAVLDRIDVTAVMAADNQMDPNDLEMLCRAVLDDEVDYAKANRLFTGEAWDKIPHYRYLGNAVLSLLTKIASGYWHVADSQTGYTAISLEMLEQIDLDRIYRRYGMPNDMLVHLNVWNARVSDYPSRPVYGVGEKSGIKLRKVVPTISWLLLKGFLFRMREKYVIRDFHPLVFFYMLGFLMTFSGLALGVLETVMRLLGTGVSVGTVVLVALLLVSGTQFTLFAMWFDLEQGRELKPSGNRHRHRATHISRVPSETRVATPTRAGRR